MRKDSTVVDFGGFVIENVTKTTDSNGKVQEIIERHGPPMGPHNMPMMPVFIVYGLLFTLIIAIIAFLGWYYFKKKTEIARLMIQNNMSPAELYQVKEKDKGISNFLKFGIILVAIGLGLLFNKILIAIGVLRFTFPILLLFVGIALILIHSIHTKKQ